MPNITKIQAKYYQSAVYQMLPKYYQILTKYYQNTTKVLPNAAQNHATKNYQNSM